MIGSAILAQSARGLPVGELVIAAVVGAVGTAVVLAVGASVRRGRGDLIRGAAGVASRAMGLPRWAALPSVVAAASMLTAVFGFYWDMSIHIDRGRDAGAFSNPSHVFILLGLVGIALSAGLSALFGHDHDAPSTSVRFRGWRMPVGALLLLVAGGTALAGFPLDEVWHRLFGQDVTLWGPTHIQMVAGASLAPLAAWVLSIEGTRTRARSWIVTHREPLLAGAFLAGLSTLQGEFDAGVPQFRLLFHPVLLMLASSIGLVAARIRLGRGGAVKAALFFIALRGLLALLIGPVLGRTVAHFPLYLVEALLVEACAARIPSSRPLRLGVVAGAAIGTVGLAAEWVWSHVWMPVPWPASLLPEALVVGFGAALAGGVLGAAIGQALSSGTPVPGRATAIAALAAVLALAIPARTGGGPPIRAELEIDRTGPRRAVVTATLDPPDAADDALWFHTLSWQGLDGMRGSSPRVWMEEVAPGTYRSAGAVPIEGTWKTLLRLHVGGRLVAVPISLPADRAIPAPAVPVPEDGAVRTFVPDARILQREAIPGMEGMRLVGHLLLFALAAGWLAAFGWGLARLGRTDVATPRSRAPVAAGRR